MKSKLLRALWAQTERGLCLACWYIASFNQEYKTSGEKVYDNLFEHMTRNNIKILMQIATNDNLSTHFYLSQQGWHTFFSLLKQSGISWSFRWFLRFSEYLAFVMVYLEQISHTIRPAESITKHQYKLRYDFHLWYLPSRRLCFIKYKLQIGEDA